MAVKSQIRERLKDIPASFDSQWRMLTAVIACLTGILLYGITTVVAGLFEKRSAAWLPVLLIAVFIVGVFATAFLLTIARRKLVKALTPFFCRNIQERRLLLLLLMDDEGSILSRQPRFLSFAWMAGLWHQSSRATSHGLAFAQRISNFARDYWYWCERTGYYPGPSWFRSLYGFISSANPIGLLPLAIFGTILMCVLALGFSSLGALLMSLTFLVTVPAALLLHEYLTKIVWLVAGEQTVKALLE